MMIARDESVADASSLTPLLQLSWWWEHCLRYHYEGPGHHIVSVQRCRARKYGACGDAAASLLAAAKRQNVHALLCVEEPSSMPDYRHVRVYLPHVDVTLDPYATKRPEGLAATCERMRQL